MTDWLVVSAETQAKLEDTQNELRKYKKFYQEVIRLTIDHDVIESINGNDYASISPRKMAEVLATIDENWFYNRDKGIMNG
jgi:hypothetical protein